MHLAIREYHGVKITFDPNNIFLRKNTSARMSKTILTEVFLLTSYLSMEITGDITFHAKRS
jgi:hypothetical protein